MTPLWSFSSQLLKVSVIIHVDWIIRNNKKEYQTDQEWIEFHKQRKYTFLPMNWENPISFLSAVMSLFSCPHHSFTGWNLGISLYFLLSVSSILFVSALERNIQVHHYQPVLPEVPLQWRKQKMLKMGKTIEPEGWCLLLASWRKSTLEKNTTKTWL